MKSQISMREPKKHGKRGYAFEKYDIISDIARQFATNHWHDETEIVYISKGAIDININGKRFVGREGDIFVINSGEMHEIYGTETPLIYSAFVFDFGMLAFREEDLAQQKFVDPVLKGKIQFQNKLPSMESAFELLKCINDINEQRRECYILSTKAYLMQFFAMVIEKGSCRINDELTPTDAKRELLRDISEYIHMHFGEEISLKQIAAEFNMSYKYFCRFFKNNFGKTFVEYLNDVRIENAVHRLESSNDSVTDIAMSCGFANMSYFSRAFKKRLECTPSRYRKDFHMFNAV